MGAPENDREETAEKIITVFAQHADKLAKVKLPGGMVGKVTWLLVVVCISITAMVWSVPNVWIALAGMILCVGSFTDLEQN